jgi:dihydrofolate synthase/folylpolyglutamate synthase
MKFGLERTEQLLDALDNPHRKFRSIHVAGTNGKGSVVATLDALLREKKLRVGRYTSPHLIDFRERMSVNGTQITERQVLDFLQRMQPLAERLHATFFELTTAMAFDFFAAERVDVAVIETGLGGRLDSTNVLTPIAASVVSIALDHTDILGDSLEQIAQEKAGIFKPEVPAIIGESSAEIRNVLVRCANEKNAAPVRVLDDECRIANVRVSRAGTEFDFESKFGSTHIRTPLSGAHQARNTAIALLTVDAAGAEYMPAVERWNAALENVFLPGRFQRFDNLIFDVAHNPAGAAMLARTIAEVNPPHPRTALVAVLGDKDWRGIMRELAPAVDRLFITLPPNAPSGREFNADEAYEYARSQGWNAELDCDFGDALRRVRKRCGTVVITGSFHTVGAAMERLQVFPAQP